MERLDRIALLAAIMAGGLGTNAAASESGWFVGAAANYSKFDVRDGSVMSGLVYPYKLGADSSKGGTLTVGFRLNRYFGAEAGYADFGEAEFRKSGVLSLSLLGSVSEGTSSIKLATKGSTLAFSGSLPLQNWELFAKIGVLFADNEMSARADGVSRSLVGPLPRPSTEFHESTTRTSHTQEIFFTAGVGYTIADHYHVKLDWTSLSDLIDEKDGEAKLGVTSLGLQYRF